MISTTHSGGLTLATHSHLTNRFHKRSGVKTVKHELLLILIQQKPCYRSLLIILEYRNPRRSDYPT